MVMGLIKSKLSSSYSDDSGDTCRAVKQQHEQSRERFIGWSGLHGSA